MYILTGTELVINSMRKRKLKFVQRLMLSGLRFIKVSTNLRFRVHSFKCFLKNSEIVCPKNHRPHIALNLRKLGLVPIISNVKTLVINISGEKLEHGPGILPWTASSFQAAPALESGWRTGLDASVEYQRQEYDYQFRLKLLSSNINNALHGIVSIKKYLMIAVIVQ